MCNCGCHTEINRDGSGQLTRFLKALDPAAAPIDGRNLSELLDFIRQYAEQIRFYDIPESKIPGTTDPSKVSWAEFFRRDMAVIAASIAVSDIVTWKTSYDQARAALEADPTADNFAALFPPVIAIMTRLDHWYSLAIPQNPLRQDLDLGIASSLKGQVKTMIGYELGFKIVDPKATINLVFTDIENPDIWGIHDSVDPDTSIFEGSKEADKILHAALFADDIFNTFYGFIAGLVNNADKYLQFALEQYPSHQPHMALFLAFLQLFQVVQEQMNGVTGRLLDFYYKDVLRLPAKPSIPDKAFVIFELAKDVAEYDLAMGTPLKAGKDALGKDLVYVTENDFVINTAKVKELKNLFIEKTLPDPTTNIKTIDGFFARPQAKSQDGFGAPFTDPSGKWPVYGRGSLLSRLTKNPCDLADLIVEQKGLKDGSRIGFAIASPQLVLQGGKRIIRMSIAGMRSLVEKAVGSTKAGTGSSTDAAGNLTNAVNLNSPFEIILSGEKGWISITRLMTRDEFMSLNTYLDKGIINPDTNISESSLYFVLNDTDHTQDSLLIYLPVSEKPIIAFDPALHTGADYHTPYPVMQVLLTDKASLSEDECWKLTMDKLSLGVQVGSVLPDTNDPANNVWWDKFGANWKQTVFLDGLPKLTLQNDDGVITTGKPFDPFTAYPDNGKSLYIGSEEVFNKPLGKVAVSVRLNRDLLGVRVFVPEVTPLAIVSHFIPGSNLALSVRQHNAWLDLCDFNGNNFSKDELRYNVLRVPDNGSGYGYGYGYGYGNTPSGKEISLPRTPIEYLHGLPAENDKGYLRIVFLTQNAATGGTTSLQDSQAMAAQLKVNEITVNYISTLDQLQAGIDQFFHIYPFGVAETFIGLPPPPPHMTTAIMHPRGTVPAPAAGTGSGAATPAGGTPAHAVPTGGLPIVTGLGHLTLILPPIPGKPTGGFSRLAKNRFLVDAQKRLLPQFTYVSPYSLFNLASAASFDYRQVVGFGVGMKQQLDSLNQYSGKLQEEGQLFIGIENASALESVSLLFQFAEGSASDEDDDPPVINWSYLHYNEWKPLKGENLVSDSTFGFKTTGIVDISIPEDANTDHTIMTQGLIWLCASVSENADRIPQVIDIVTQATEVTFVDNGNDQAHFDNPLPAGSISKLATPVQQVKTVKQPFASFDGKHKETGKEYYTRVSERLRHKSRAITAWDYEHLVLDRFPSIYKVKCIPHTDPNCLCRTVAGKHAQKVKHITPDAGKAEAMLENEFNRLISIQHDKGGNENCCGPQVAPGHVLLVPIANLKNRNAVNPLKPKTARITLLEIEQYLQQKVSPFVKVHAKNPVYEEIIVAFRVKFLPGFDIGFHLKMLNEEIVHFLTPWAFDANAEVKFGQKIYASTIINFIEERPYVDFITDFFMAVCREECCRHDHSHEPVKNTPVPTTGGQGGATTPGNTPAAAGPGVNVQGGLTLTDTELATALSEACGCEEVLYLLVGHNKFRGEIVAVPSGPRSILVSVPKHIIVPYEEPLQLSPCEKRKLNPLKPPASVGLPGYLGDDQPAGTGTSGGGVAPPPPPPPPPPPTGTTPGGAVTPGGTGGTTPGGTPEQPH